MKQLVYARFSAAEKSGISYSLFNESMREYLEGDESRTFVMEIDLPDVPKEEVVKMGVKSIDEDIAKINAESHRGIERLKAKKEQLLALTHDSVE